jgi:hypothetical protein
VSGIAKKMQSFVRNLTMREKATKNETKRSILLWFFGQNRSLNDAKIDTTKLLLLMKGFCAGITKKGIH